MKKKFAFVVAFLLSGASLMAQRTIETVYLKNGSVIRGTVIEQMPGLSLKVQTKDGSVFVYQMDEVERIAKEQATGFLSFGSNEIEYTGVDVTIGGGLLAVADGAMGMGGIEVGKRFSQNFYWGMGVGVETAWGEIYLPITTTFKAFIPLAVSSITPNLAFRTGFLANIGDDYHGWEIGLLPGFQLPLTEKIDFNVNIGYLCGIAFGDGAYNAFMLNVGFGFHKPKIKRRL